MGATEETEVLLRDHCSFRSFRGCSEVFRVRAGYGQQGKDINQWPWSQSLGGSSGDADVLRLRTLRATAMASRGSETLDKIISAKFQHRSLASAR
jgi:hypothetical protein